MAHENLSIEFPSLICYTAPYLSDQMHLFSEPWRRTMTFSGVFHA